MINLSDIGEINSLDDGCSVISINKGLQQDKSWHWHGSDQRHLNDNLST